VTNNDVLRRIRYAFDIKDNKLVKIFGHGALAVELQQVQRWLKKDDDEQMLALSDFELASFLNGFIIEKRGKRDGEQAKAENTLTKNLILMKLKIALTLQTDDIVKLLASTGFTVGQSELSAFFRKPEHKNYRHCKAQFLRNFLQAVQEKYRPQSNENSQHKNNSASKAHYDKNKKHNKTTPTEKKHYVNPKLNQSKPKDKSSRKVLKLKPEDIYKQ